MKNAFKLGYRCADSLLPAIMTLPEEKKKYLLHVLKGYAIGENVLARAHAYEVENRVRFSDL